MPTIPKNYNEAISGDNAQNWIKAMKKELDSLIENDTFESTTAPNDKNIIGSRWVYSLKFKNGNNCEYKARFVAQKDSHRYMGRIILTRTHRQRTCLPLESYYRSPCKTILLYIIWMLKQRI